MLLHVPMEPGPTPLSEITICVQTAMVGVLSVQGHWKISVRLVPIFQELIITKTLILIPVLLLAQKVSISMLEFQMLVRNVIANV